jgi:hypothetical protein
MEAGRPLSLLDLAAALVVHICTLPLFLLLVFGFGQYIPAPPAPFNSLAAWIVFALPFCAWGWLGVKLVLWWQKGRGPVWSYPLRWTLALIGTFMFITIFALLIPSYRRELYPRQLPPR